MRTIAPLAVVASLLAPVAAGAQGFALTSPSIGDSLRRMDRLVEDAERREMEQGFRQSYVLPERPGQNKVAWYDFEWEYVDVPAPGGGRGGIRLYYYKSALAQAQRALPAIQSAYARLVDQFAYQPTKRIPYFLYATQREFQATNIFQIGEATLGVTSTQGDLRMLVPYFGDHQKFVEVSTHEMVHQFYIQKLNDAAEAEDLGSLAGVLPLWFTEGIAEWYTKGGLDVETDGYLRDLVWNPDPSEGYMMIPFAEDRARGYIPTYKLGQARVEFIAQEYGRDKIQGLIENAYLLGDGAGAAPGGRSFGALVRRVLDEPLEQVEARWKSWLKRRYYAQYLKTRQDLSQLKEMRNLPAEPEDFTASPDGQLILMRGIDREKGRARLYLFDVRNPRSAQEVATDSKPGTESLHPIEFAVGTVGPGILAFSAQDGQGDSLYLRRYRVQSKEGRPPQIQLGKLRKVDMTAPGGKKFVQIADPAFSLDGSHVAFSGLVAGDPQSDVWVVKVEGGEARRLTNDPYVERDLHWGPDGIYAASDATEHGLLNLFRIDPGTGEKLRLTTAAHTDRHPFAQADGSVLYSSDSEGNKVDLYLLKDGAIRRVTDFTTGLTSPAPAPKARGIFATTFNGGKFRLVEVPKSAWLESPAVAVGPAVGPPLEIPRAEWPEQPKEYDAYAMRNWRPEGGYIFGGGAGNTVSGRAAVLFSDLLRDNVLFVDLAVYGSFDYTQGLFLYENRSHRYGLVFGGFHFVQQTYDPLDAGLVYYQREFGLVGAIRYPLDRFRRVELELTGSGIERYCLTDFRTSELTLACDASTLARPPYDSPGGWKKENGGVNFQVSPVLRYGYDTTRYDPATGPVSGSSATVELGGAYLPGRGALTGFARTDLQRYWQLGTRANFSLRFAAGTSFSDSKSRVWERSYWLTAADNLRGFYPGEYGNLIGRNYYVSNAELQIPLDPLIRFFIFDYVEGVVALDFGGVFDRIDSKFDGGLLTERGAWDSRTLTGVLGFNMLFGPLILRLHWGHPYDIGGYQTTALQNGSRWVTHVTLRYFFQ